MAAATKGANVRPVTPVGYEFNDKCELDGAVTRGDLLKATGVYSNGLIVMEKAPAGTTEADGIALMDGADGERGFDYGLHGEMDGFESLTIGPYYPSASVAGGLDTVAAGLIRVKAISPTRIRFMFV